MQALRHANGWHRDTAQRLIVERGARDTAPHLRRLLRDEPAVARLHALWTLDQLGVLDDADIGLALRDASAPVRENALRLAERRLGQDDGLLDAVLPLHDDPDARVRLHAALALGASRDPRRFGALAEIARRGGADRWTRAAVLSSVGTEATAFFDVFRQRPPAGAEAHGAVLEDLARLFGSSASTPECLALLRYISAPSADVPTWQLTAMNGLATGLRARDQTLQSIVAAGTSDARAAATQLAALVTQATTLAGDARVPIAARIAAIALLGHAGGDNARQSLTRWLDPREPHDVQAAVVRALVDTRERAGAALLLAPGRWDSFTPQLRVLVLTTVLGDDRLVPVLLEAVESGAVPAAAVGGARWRRLTAHRDAAIRGRAAAIHATSDAGAAQRAFERVRGDVLARDGDRLRGARVFEQQCAVCHTFTSAGGRIGPDLSGVRNQPADALLLHIVVPDYEITPGYEAFSVETRDGRSLFGRLESETPNGVTLRDAAGQSHAIVRNDILSMRAATSSLMPVGLEEAMSAQELADLLAYLKRGDR